jgi:hypothetical protein
MFNRIIFFNHYHRGDLFTHKEFVREIKSVLKNVDYEYWHFNHPKVNLDLKIPLTGVPKVPQNHLFYRHEDILLINTWIGVHSQIFNECGGVNLQSLSRSWETIYETINSLFGTHLVTYNDVAKYLPTIDYSFFNLETIEKFLEQRSNTKKVLLCNGAPMSNQSFQSSLEEEVKEFATKYSDIDFICTKKFNCKESNVFFTDDIIADKDEYAYKTPWNDRSLNNCDLNEISYLSTKCDMIIGKNSGPFVFCETYQNLMDSSKKIISFSRGERESMSNGIDKKCDYHLVTDHSRENVKTVIERELNRL